MRFNPNILFVNMVTVKGVLMGDKHEWRGNRKGSNGDCNYGDRKGNRKGTSIMA